MVLYLEIQMEKNKLNLLLIHFNLLVLKDNLLNHKNQVVFLIFLLQVLKMLKQYN